MRTSVALAALAVSALFGSNASAQFAPVYESIAITEFLVTPIGEEEAREWVELYNFGKEPVDLKGFQLTDGKNEICNIPAVTIKPNDFVIVVLGRDHQRYDEDRKKIFEAEWLGGKADDRVVGIDSSFRLGRAMTLILQNRRRTPLWILGYKADDKAGQSTYLAIKNFQVRSYGTAEKPAIDRRGPDGTVLGYESQDATKEAAAYTSEISKLEQVGGFVFKSKAAGGTCEPSVGSPLKGDYAQ